MSHENRPNNAKAPTSPAVRMVFAALVVAEVAALVLLADPVEVAIAVPVVPVLLVFSLLAAPITPPKTCAGTVESWAFAAAALNEFRVSPLELQGENIWSTASGLSTVVVFTYGGLMTPTMPAWQCPGTPQ